MPPPPVPGAVPVAFDDAAAATLMTDLNLLGRGLCALAIDLEDAAADAGRDWRGSSRRWFDDRRATVGQDLRQAAGDAFRAARDVQAAVQRATATQELRNVEVLRRDAVELARLTALAAAPAHP